MHVALTRQHLSYSLDTVYCYFYVSNILPNLQKPSQGHHSDIIAFAMQKENESSKDMSFCPDI